MDSNALYSFYHPCMNKLCHCIQICLFSEGTRFTEEKHKKSLEYARKQGLPQLKHLLLPRTKGFNVMIRQLKDHVPYIFDTTFAFPHGIITLTDVFQGNKVYADVHVRSDSGSYDSQSIYLLIHMYCKANTCF
jgi:hypothetical protein